MTEFERSNNYHHEFRAPEIRPVITPEILVADNESSEAADRMAKWYENYREGKITLIWRCSDARVINPSPESTMVVNTVAATDDLHKYIRLISGVAYQNLAIIGHYNGEALATQHAPSGCGAEDEKFKLSNGEIRAEKGILKRVDQQLISHDVVIQVSHNASHLSEHTTKPVIAIAQDHRTGENNVVGVFYTEGDDINTSEPRILARYKNGEVSAEEVYGAGLIPTINHRNIPHSFLELLAKGNERIQQISRQIPNFYDSQKVQDPTAIVLTTDPQPIENRYPELFGNPNSAFQLLVPRTTTSTDARIQISGLRLATDHAEYPLTQTIRNYETGGPFANTNTIFIETKDMEKSQFLASYLLGRDFIDQFLRLSDDHQIIIGETKQGKLRQVIRFE